MKLYGNIEIETEDKDHCSVDCPLFEKMANTGIFFHVSCRLFGTLKLEENSELVWKFEQLNGFKTPGYYRRNEHCKRMFKAEKCDP